MGSPATATVIVIGATLISCRSTADIVALPTAGDIASDLETKRRAIAVLRTAIKPFVAPSLMSAANSLRCPTPTKSSQKGGLL